MPGFDAIILAGGRSSPEMAARTGTPIRALFPYQGKPFAQWVFEAVRACPDVERVAVVGPPELADIPSVRDADLLMPEGDSVESNLFGTIARLLPEGRLLVTASDNPLLTSEAFHDLLARAPEHAAVSYPILRHEAFLRQFPRAENIAIRVKDGRFIGGGCAILHSKSIPKLQRAIQAVLSARKSKQEMLALLGWKFALKFTLKRATSAEVEQRICDILDLPFRFVRDSSPLLAIDIDDPEDWDYLLRWSPSRASPPRSQPAR